MQFNRTENMYVFPNLKFNFLNTGHNQIIRGVCILVFSNQYIVTMQPELAFIICKHTSHQTTMKTFAHKHFSKQENKTNHMCDI
jgi:hypothetical protein